MRSSTAAALVALFVTAAGCAPPPGGAVRAADAVSLLDTADRLVEAGCLECLIDAYEAYERLSADRLIGERASLAAVEAAALVALRERELGLIDSGYMEKAAARLASMTSAPDSLSQLLDVADRLPIGPAGARPEGADGARVLLQVSREWLESPAPPLGLAAHDRLFGYVWLTLACDPANARAIRSDQALAGIGDLKDLPLMVFKYAVSCERGPAPQLQSLLEAEPRFGEINYYLGLAALSGQVRAGAPGRPDLDEADARLRQAWAWRSGWPALMLTLGNIAATAEDFVGALELYDRTLELVPGQPDALLGRVRCLTYLNRHREAVAVTEELIEGGRHPGDVRYWRALNELHLARYEEAWADIELASTLVVNADVPKLAGVIAIHRNQTAVARGKLEEARARRPGDCEIGFYLQTVLAEQRAWREAAATASEAGACFDQDEERLRAEIDQLRASSMAAARQERLAGTRADQIRTNAGMRAACWFNAAAAHFNIGAHDEARAFAEKVVDDDRFGDRARDLLARLSAK